MNNDPRLRAQVAEHPFPLVFATISGAHLYGFPSADSDADLRGAHVLPLTEVLRLHPGHATIERSGIREQLEIDLVTHDVHKFFGMLLKKNGYVLEQLLSPLVVHATAAHEELVALAPGCLTRFHAFHYLGFAQTQWKLFQKESPPRVKPLLYVYRVLLTGLFLMETGRVEAHLPTLNAHYRLGYLPELIERKRLGREAERLEAAELDFHQREYDRLHQALHDASQTSHLPEHPTAAAALDDLLVRIRIEYGAEH